MPGATGLDGAHESAYRTLLGLGAAEPAELADRLTLPETAVLRILRRLEWQGLAARSASLPGRWVAADAATPPPGVPRPHLRPAPGGTDSTTTRSSTDGTGGANNRAGAGEVRETAARTAPDSPLDGNPARHVPAPSPERRAGAMDGPDATDLRILSLLLAGLTDASAAKQLDLGLRTVQRRMKRLMELTGVSTRLQLGWQACERGWLPGGTRSAPPVAETADPARTPRTDPGPDRERGRAPEPAAQRPAPCRTAGRAAGPSGTAHGGPAGHGGGPFLHRPVDDGPLPGHPPHEAS
nr:helix-turn-helix domain-containing protein [Streptomyces zingiberis]